MHTSRRTLIASLAALPLATAAAAKTTVDTVDDDPIFAAIARHRATWAAAASPAAYTVTERSLLATYDAVLATVPRTVAGCRALVDFMIDDADTDAPPTLDVLRQALDRIATAT